MKPETTASLGQHYLRYSSATVLIMVAGLVSFPALTRMLDNTQYGILGYYDTWLMLTIAVVKLGGQHAILRMYPFGGTQAQLTHFSTNLVFLPMLVSIGLWLLVMLVAGSVVWVGDMAVSPVFWAALLLMPLLVFTSQVEMTLRVSERSSLLNVSRVSSRWIELALILGIVFAIERSAFAVYGGKIAAAVLLVLFYMRWVRGHLHFSRAALDFGAYRSSLRYSLPLVANEMAGMLLVSIDRVMLKSMLGDYAAVGIYTIGCALAMQVNLLMNEPLWAAFNPAANRIHGTEGSMQVRALKDRVLLPTIYASIGIGVAIWAVGAEVLLILTGPSKAASGPVFMWLGTLFAVLPILNVSGYGLLLQKRTMMVLIITALGALLNIGLNLVWIPIYGIMGSVYATVISYAALALARCLLCPRDLMQWPDWRRLLVAGSAAAAFLLAVKGTDLFGLAQPWTRVAAAGGMWLLFYLVPVLALDRRLRHVVFRRSPLPSAA